MGNTLGLEDQSTQDAFREYHERQKAKKLGLPLPPRTARAPAPKKGGKGSTTRREDKENNEGPRNKRGARSGDEDNDSQVEDDGYDSYSENQDNNRSRNGQRGGPSSTRGQGPRAAGKGGPARTSGGVDNSAQRRIALLEEQVRRLTREREGEEVVDPDRFVEEQAPSSERDLLRMTNKSRGRVATVIRTDSAASYDLRNVGNPGFIVDGQGNPNSSRNRRDWSDLDVPSHNSSDLYGSYEGLPSRNSRNTRTRQSTGNIDDHERNLRRRQRQREFLERQQAAVGGHFNPHRPPPQQFQQQQQQQLQKQQMHPQMYPPQHLQRPVSLPIHPRPRPMNFGGGIPSEESFCV